MSANKEREDFEAWCRTKGWLPVHLARSIVDGSYAWSRLNATWEAWLARATLPSTSTDGAQAASPKEHP